ncbi:hypothetical protein ACFVAV_19215 [Nocardia sp. NPDC057663]|uniref:hypothetical protein n=1 Tax=Nocardia sp. NPDC057663 TaxID=3346201 RepID=UPI00366D8BFF
MTTLGFVIAIGLPLAVLVGVVFWPTQVPPDRTVEEIRRRVEAETERNRVRRRS